MSPAAPACRFGDRCHLHTIEDVIECVGSHSEKTRTEIAERMAELTGKSAAYFRACLSPHDGTHNLQFAYLPALIEASGNTAPIRWLAERFGLVLHRKPSVEASSREALVSVNDVYAEVGEMARVMALAARDGTITRAEAREYRRVSHRAIAEILESVETVDLAAERER